MAATRKARNAPMANPKAMPKGKDRTLRANHPMSTPAINPLKVEPMTIPINCARTSGVNQAVNPSMAPRTVPSRTPSQILFMFSLLVSSSSSSRRYRPQAAQPLKTAAIFLFNGLEKSFKQSRSFFANILFPRGNESSPSSSWPPQNQGSAHDDVSKHQPEPRLVATGPANRPAENAF